MPDDDSQALEQLIRRVLGANVNTEPSRISDGKGEAPTVNVYGDVNISIGSICNSPCGQGSRRTGLSGQATSSPAWLHRALSHVPPLASNDRLSQRRSGPT